MKTVAFVNRKGGTGKTTSAVSMAACLAERGKNVVVIDIDPQANATAALGVERAAKDDGIAALLTNGQPGNLLRASPYETLEVIPSSTELAEMEMQLNGAANWQSLLRRRIAPLADTHDIVIIDCPPSLGALTINALIACNGVVVPVQCDYFSLEGIASFIANIEKLRATHNPHLTIYGLLRTMYDPRTVLTRDVTEQLHRHFGSKVFQATIPRTVRLAEAPSHGLPITLYAASAPAAAAYRAATDELARALA